jgi:hypothetical protein
MAAVEKIVVLCFLGTIALVYYFEIRFALVFAFNKLRRRQRPNPFLGRSAFVIHLLAGLGVLCFLYGYFVEPYRIEVTIVEIKTDKLKEASFRIVQISDTHCDRKIRNEDRVVEIVNALEADVVVFTGDSINTAAAGGAFKEMMRKVEAKIGKYAVRGNFDVWYWSQMEVFEGTGFEVLDEESVLVEKDNEAIEIAGIGIRGSGWLSKTTKDLSAERFGVLLHHYPDLIEEPEIANVDLYLAGHTHGGQVALPLYGAMITLSKYGKRYEAGKYVVGDTILYVNRGIGMEGGRVPRVRFCARPEITVFDIVPEQD